MHLYLRLMKRDEENSYSASEQAALRSLLEASAGVHEMKTLERHLKGGYAVTMNVEHERRGDLADHLSSRGLVLVM